MVIQALNTHGNAKSYLYRHSAFKIVNQYQPYQVALLFQS